MSFPYPRNIDLFLSRVVVGLAIAFTCSAGLSLYIIWQQSQLS